MKGLNNAISVVNDPFKIDKVVEFNIWCNISIFSKRWEYSGEVIFKNGNTKGEQQFEGEDLESLLKKMKAFMESL